MNVPRAAVILLAAFITASCSEKAPREGASDADASAEVSPKAARAPEAEPARREATLQPPSESKIGKDCVALVRGTRVVPPAGGSTDCPGCPAGGSEALSVRQVRTEAVSCAGDTCNVLVWIRAVFNPASGEALAGGLTAWIPAEQRSAYLNGQTPADEQEYRVAITYKHRGGGWQPIEFDRASAQ